MLLIEIPVALLLGVASVLREGGRADEQTVARPMDWVPVLWFGGFTLGVLVIAVIFLCSAHPFAGAVQLLLAAVALFFTIHAWHDQYEGAHPAPPPARAWMPHAPSDHMACWQDHNGGSREPSQSVAGDHGRQLRACSASE
ncbi:DUF6234 family protein [Streptomyces sp. NPDC029041]|uniref:DUF6234 family protein n=1 Tax=Streptomyces sp. NPDC029041 TaxID=3155727 RepID=UPI0033C71616